MAELCLKQQLINMGLKLRGNKHMKNYKVRPEHIIDLVGKVAASFNAWQLEYKHLPVNMRAEYMHYMSDMLDDLINTAYPIEEQEVDTKAESVISALNRGYESREKAMKEFRSPMDSNINSRILKQIFNDKSKMAELDKQLEAVAEVVRDAKRKSKEPEGHKDVFRPKRGDIVILKDGYKGNYMDNIEGTDEHRMWLENGLVRGFKEEDVLHIRKNIGRQTRGI